LALGLGLAGLGCSEDTKCDPAPSLAACPMEGMGTLAIKVEGLPDGVMPAVTVTGPAGTVPFAASSMVGGGTYMVSAARVAAPDPIVRRAFVPAVMGSPVCVKNAMTGTVTVKYTEIASSNKLWMGNANGRAPLLGYASMNLRATGSAAATVAAMTKGSRGSAFDKDGNLWVAGDTTADPALLRYPAAMLGASGTKTADITINTASLNGGAPRTRALAFDAMGNLYVSVIFSGKVVRFGAAQLMATGNPTPEVELSGFKGPQALAFDMMGNLWVANAGENQVVRLDAVRLGMAGMFTAGLTITVKTPPPVIGDRSNPNSLAFDKAGNLWVGYEGAVVKLPASDLAGTGKVELTAAIQIGADVLALPEGMAFDEGGGLWFAASQGKFARLGPDQLTSGGMKTPSTLITSADVGSGTDIAIFPAPAGLPLYAVWP
jgi:sugar lactone lactonase YvrE